MAFSKYNKIKEKYPELEILDVSTRDDGVCWVSYKCPTHGYGEVKYDTARKRHSSCCKECSKEVIMSGGEYYREQRMKESLEILEKRYLEEKGMSVSLSRDSKGKSYSLKCYQCKDDMYAKNLGSPYVFSIRKNALNVLGVPCRCSRSARLTKEEFELKAKHRLLNHNPNYTDITFKDEYCTYLCECGKVNSKTIHDIIKGGSGCSGCCVGGYCTNSLGYLYLLVLENTGELFIKVGITNNIKDRITLLTSKSNGGSVLKKSYIFSFEDGSVPPELEKQLLNSVNSEKCFKRFLRQGFTEAFTFCETHIKDFKDLAKKSGGVYLVQQ